jgi:hypothetical protein
MNDKVKINQKDLMEKLNYDKDTPVIIIGRKKK